MITRVSVALEQPEYSALLEIALKELRTPADQLRYILRQKLTGSTELSTKGFGGAEVELTMKVTTDELQHYRALGLLFSGDKDILEIYGSDIVDSFSLMLDILVMGVISEDRNKLKDCLERVLKSIRM